MGNPKALYEAVKSGKVRLEQINEEGKAALKWYMESQKAPIQTPLSRIPGQQLEPAKEQPRRSFLSRLFVPTDEQLSSKKEAEKRIIERVKGGENPLKAYSEATGELTKDVPFAAGVLKGSTFIGKKPEDAPWTYTAGEMAGTLLPFSLAYKGARAAVKGASKLIPALAKPIPKLAATGGLAGAPVGAASAIGEGEGAKEVAKRALLFGTVGAVLDPTVEKILFPIARTAFTKVAAQFKRKPVDVDSVAKAIGEDIGVKWENINETQKSALRKLAEKAQGEAVQSGRLLNPIPGEGPGFIMSDPNAPKKIVQELTPKEKNFFDFLIKNKKDINAVISEVQSKKDKILSEYIQYLKSAGGKGVTQGGLIRNEAGDVVGRFGRQSNNPGWYQEFFRANGRAPTNKEYYEIALKQLREGIEKEGIPANTEFVQLENTFQGLKQMKNKPLPLSFKTTIEVPRIYDKTAFTGQTKTRRQIAEELGVLPQKPLAPPQLAKGDTVEFAVTQPGQRPTVGTGKIIGMADERVVIDTGNGGRVIKPIEEVKRPLEKPAVLPSGEATEIGGPLYKLDDLTDISGAEGYTTDVYRIFKKVFGKHYDKVKRTILDPFDAGKKANAEFQKAWLKELDEKIVKGLGIKPDSKLSKLTMQFGEKRISLDELKLQAPNDWQKAIEADRWFRQAYDQLIDQVNATRARVYPGNPDKIIPRRQDYYRHFQEITNDIQGLRNIFTSPAQIDPKLEGISEFTKPKSKWQSFAQRRTGGMPFKDDAVGSFLNYLPSASYGIHIDPHISKFQNLAKTLAEETSETKGLNNFIRFLGRYSQDLAGKTNPIDRIAQEITGRSFFRGLDWLNRRVKANVILANAGASLSQLANIPQGIAYAKQYAVPGLKRTVRSIFVPNEAIQKSGFVTERYLDKMYRQFDTDLLSKPRNLAIWLMETSDKMGTHFIWNSLYEKASREGMKDAVKYADDITREMVAGRGIGEVPLAQKSRIVQTLIPFTLEVANLWKVQKDLVSKKDIVGLLLLYAAAFTFNEVTERTRGTRVVFDPIDALRDAFSEDDLTPLQRGGRLVGEVVSNLPTGQFLGSVYPEYGTTIGGVELPTRKELFGENDPTRFGTGLLIQKGLQDPLYKVAMPFGGMQLKKTIGGIQALSKGGVYKPSGEELKYPVSQDLLNQAKGVMFGPSGFREARKYYEENRRPLSENQTKQVQQNPAEYENIMKQRRINTINNKIKDIQKDKTLTIEEKKEQINRLLKQREKVMRGE